ncbi:unnamed protein product [Orchesella dallaii]|uniref:Uncharacterized protein n=1 Tax=Orchesella dallaii TaxID=48710 RepID=A0ABP1R888_9HEXA
MKSKFLEINSEDRFMYRQPSTVDCTVAMFRIEGVGTKYFKCTSKRRVIIFESYFALLYPGQMVKRLWWFSRAAKMDQEFDDSQLEFQSEIKRLNEQVNSESQRALRAEQVQQEQLATLQALNKHIEDEAEQLKEQHLHEKNELQNEMQQKDQTISDEQDEPV